MKKVGNERKKWVEEELKDTELGDKRLVERLKRMVSDLAAQPNASVLQASGDEAAAQGMYDFWSNRRIEPNAILSGHQQSTVKRIQEHQTVLAIQDTSELDYSKHGKTRGLGPISEMGAKGLKVHSVMAASDRGVPLGLLHQKVWSRESRRALKGSKRSRSIEQKESVRWIESLEACEQLVPEEVRVITVADREADIYELFAHPRRENSELLIRAAQNRNTRRSDAEEIKPLFEAIRAIESQGEIKLELQRTPRRKARDATLEVRFTELWLQPPGHLAGMAPVKVWVILAEEQNPPAGETAVSWLLLSTIAVEEFGTACQCLKWYSSRWLIERYHFTLKSGCRLEELQLKESERLERALATYAIVSWRLLWLVYESRQNGERSVEGILERVEWQALYGMVHQTKRVPETAPSIRESIRWIGSLGGHLGRKGDGEPGVCTLWRGLQRLHDIAAGWLLFQESH